MLHVIKGKHLQSRLLYPLWISFRFKGEIKNFTDNQKLREFSGTESALQKTLKKLLQTGNIRERKGLHNQIQNNNVNGKRIMCINNFLKSKWLNAPIKRHKLAEWIQKKKKKNSKYASTRDPPQTQGHIQTESEGLENNISCKRKSNKVGAIILL